MRYTGISLTLGIIFFLVVFSLTTKPGGDPVLYYNTNGLINISGHQQKFYFDSTLNPSGSLAQTFNISSAGFSRIFHVELLAKDSTGTVSNMGIVSLDYYNLSTVYYNIITSNTTLVSILGVNVNGLTAPATPPSGTVVYCMVWGI